jgi:hypothetical protein
MNSEVVDDTEGQGPPDPVQTVEPYAKNPCGARTRDGTPCRQRAMPNGRCRMHGGRTPKGVAAVNYQGKDRSRYLPKNLRKLYKEAAEDPEWTSLQEAINVLRSREAELYGQMEALPAVPWAALGGTAKDVFRAQEKGDPEALAAALESLRQLVDEGAAAARGLRGTWNELRALYQEHAKLVATESRRLNDLQAKLPVEYVLMLIRSVLETVKVVAEAKLGKDNARPLLTEVMERATRLIPAE